MHTEGTVGKSKVASGKQFLQQLNPTIQVETIQAKATTSLLDDLLPSVDVVLDCTDNFQTRQLINASCVKHQKPLVSGSALRFDGQASVFDSRDTSSPCYACIFSPDATFEEISCASMGIFSPLVGIIGSIQAGSTSAAGGDWIREVFGGAYAAMGCAEYAGGSDSHQSQP